MAIRTETIAFRMSETEKRQLEACAKSKDIPVSQLIREAIRNYLKESE